MVLLGLALHSRKLRRFSIELPFGSPVLKKLFAIPLHLILVTFLYLAVIYFIYRKTSWVIDITSHIAALVLSYWIAAFLLQAPLNLGEQFRKLFRPKQEVTANV
jgi:hypothetical protein